MAVIRFICLLVFVFGFASPTVGQEMKLRKGTDLTSAFVLVSEVYDVNFAYNPNVINSNYVLPNDLTISSPLELLESMLPEDYGWKYVGNTIVISLIKGQLVDSPASANIPEVYQPKKNREIPIAHERDTIAFSLKEISGISSLENVSLLPSAFNLSAIQLISVEDESINSGKSLVWKHQPYLSMFNYQQTSRPGKRSNFYGIGGGMIVSAHKSQWYLSASVSYNQILNNYPQAQQDSLAVIDSVGVSTDTLSTSVAHLKSFMKYTVSLGYKFRLSPTFAIPVELGVSTMQILSASEGYHPLLYNGYLAIPITLNHKRISLSIAPYIELGINNDFKHVEFKSKRLLFGLNISMKL